MTTTYEIRIDGVELPVLTAEQLAALKTVLDLLGDVETPNPALN